MEYLCKPARKGAAMDQPSCESREETLTKLRPEKRRMTGAGRSRGQRVAWEILLDGKTVGTIAYDQILTATALLAHADNGRLVKKGQQRCQRHSN